jgi:Spy/CpxP family protein refolding chaperone
MKYPIEKKWINSAAACLALAFFLVIPAQAFPPDEGGGPGRGMCGQGACPQAFGIWRNPEMVRELKITDEQVGVLKEADFKFRDNQVELISQIDKLYLEMDKAFSRDAPDNDAIIQLAKKIADAKGLMFVHQIESRLEMGKILTADQMKKLKTRGMSFHHNRPGGSCPKAPMKSSSPDAPVDKTTDEHQPE